MGSTTKNGNGARKELAESENPTISDRLDDYASGLQQMLDQEQARLADLRSQTRDAERVVEKLQGAIRLLKSDKAKKVPTTRAAKSKPKYVGNRAPSEEIMDAVLAAVEAQPDGTTLNEVCTVTGRSHDPVRRALVVLREREIIRKSGQRPDSREHIYKLMPNG